MSVATSTNHSSASEQVRARQLPADFGEDDGEVIALRAEQAEIKAERDEAERALNSFSEAQGNRSQGTWAAEAEIKQIDDDRPKLLARCILAGGDFTSDANQQRRRRELELLVERHRLAIPVLAQMRKDLSDAAIAAGRRSSAIAARIDEVLQRLRLERVAAQH